MNAIWLLVTVASQTDSSPRLLFSDPWDPVVVRRGDALGLRALADQFADAVAPDLSNRVRDGRWVTILAWCLAHSHEAFHASGGRSVVTRAEQRQRYAWLRPLELMWIARTVALAHDWGARTLNGRRRVAPWYVDGRKKPDRFGLSEEQFRAYRQTGMYGGYRLVFRKWPGMTLASNGWTPGPATRKLASWLDHRLKEARLPWRVHEADDNDDLSSSAKRGRGKEHNWWLRKWTSFDQGDRQADMKTLPRPRDEFSRLPEASLLEPLVFGSDERGKIRRAVANEVAMAIAQTHREVCDHLAHRFTDNPLVVVLPHFSRFADAGMEAMELIAGVLGSNPSVLLSDVAGHPEAARVCQSLFDAARVWNRCSKPFVRHIESANRFAEVIASAEPNECLRAVLIHHETYGGGLRWFVLRDNSIEPRSPPSAGSGRYRFRLWSLCRLAVQCGVIGTMPHVIREDEDADDEEDSDHE